jgi:probable rRNA maturation factor
MRRLNRQYRGVDKTTDVISFPQCEKKTPECSVDNAPGVVNTGPQDFVLGDIVVNLHQAKRQAAELGCSFTAELKRLLIHGLLHLIGYDHEKGARYEREMTKKENDLFMKIE